ncbi:kelch-like protein 40a [Amphiprion ocellaris]|uniref:BTB domain-containing protein n=1 Tax=Amphiprion ocellaris TaxID=80972 RepID=A0A3Q1BWK5_AMPOC|nr:kelch-like protein 40a [Amphiprion ocellaris]XP_035810636.1 kelch-like protein 40a [Amphiprion ocellaris]
MAALTIDPVEQPRMYQQTLLQDGLCDLLENDKFVDCVLKIQDKEFPCHRLVLAASSPFFKAMFLSDLEESKRREIVLKDVEPGVMGMILRYLYTSEINLTEQNVQDIFMVANMYQIPSIFSVCVSYLQEKLVLGNCLAIFRLGLLLDCPRLALAAREFICERYPVVVRDQDFLQLGPSELAILITSDALNVDREELVFESLMDWVGHDETNRLKDLPELLHCVRFRLIPLDYFKEKVERHQFIRFSQEIKKELDLVKDAHKGRLPKPKKMENDGAKGGEGSEDEEDDEEGYLPGILNNNPRFGMFEMELILMINDTGTVAYDPVGNECFVVSESTEIPKNHSSLVTSHNQVFVVGGLLYNEENKDEPFSSYFLQFDPVSSEWLGMPSQPNPRCLFGLTEAENSIFVVGGKELKDGEHALSSVMIYDRQSFKWGESDPLPYEVYGHGTVSHNGLVYVIGGKSESKKCMRRCCVYNPTKFEWKDLAPLKTARSLFGITVHKDQIFAATGVTDSGLTSTVEVYDIATNKWSEFTEFPQERSSLNLISVGGFLHAVGGFAMMPSETSEEPVPTEMTDIWRYDEAEKCWNGILREISYAEGSTILPVSLNTLRLTKL